MSAKRCRNSGEKGSEVLADRLAGFPSKSFVKYHDCHTYEELPILSKSKELLIKAAPAVLALKTSTMTMKVARALMTELVSRNAKAWKLKPESIEDYIGVMARRLRNALHDWQIAIKQKSPWALELIEEADEDDEDDDDDDDDDDEDADNGVKTEHGWDEELVLGWRAPEGAKKKDRELSLALIDDEALPDEANVTVEFDNGDKFTLPSTTMGMVRVQVAKQLKASCIWEAEHKIAHHRIWTAQRVDRTLLLSVYEQARQICQVRLDLFGDLPQPQPAPIPDDHPAIPKAMQFMEPLLKRFIADDIKDAQELKQARDVQLKAMGLHGRRSRKHVPEKGQPPLLVNTMSGKQPSEPKEGTQINKQPAEAADESPKKKKKRKRKKTRSPAKHKKMCTRCLWMGKRKKGGGGG